MKKKPGLMIQATLLCLGFLLAGASAQAQQCPQRPNLKIDAHTLDFSEKIPVCVRRNGTFRIKLIPLNGYPLDYDDVIVRQKSGWKKIKKKSVNGQGVMTVDVGDFPVGTDPAYKIKVKGVGVLDPRVRIIHSFLAFHDGLEDIEDRLLEDYGLSLSGLLEMDQLLEDEFDTSLVSLLEIIREGKKAQAD